MAHRYGARVTPIGDARRPPGDGEITVALRAILAGLVDPDPHLSRAAVGSAQVLDDPRTSASVLASLSRELQRTVEYLVEANRRDEEQP